ncbi:nonstructural protein [Dipodfec virus UOA04_Rod_742]|nr:nonstructural protein [Dipodfec virus UOA04_Rod_742]
MMNTEPKNLSKENLEELKPHPIFSIYDRKLQKYLPPFTAESLEDGKRQFSNIVNYSNTLMCRFPEDYELVVVGSFYDDLGFINVCGNEYRINGADLKLNDTLKYDELLKEVKSQVANVSNVIQEYQQIDTEYSRKLRLLDSKYKELTDKEVKLYEPTAPAQDIDKSAISKWIDKLFR